MSAKSRTNSVRNVVAGVLSLALVVLTGGCVAGESSADEGASTVTIDFATYNPISLVLKEKGWLEDALADQDVTLEWVQSAGSNKANEALRSGAIQVGSTAGSAALLARSNGSPIKTIDIYSQPEWSALVTNAGSPIASVADLKGKQVAATKGTDPYFFLVQALATAGLTTSDVTVQNLQHADGWAALQNGSVDAWAGLDPIMGNAEASGATLFYRNVDFNSYGFLNATEDFLESQPEVAQTIVNAYEAGRAWALANPEETAQILADAAGIDLAVATTVINDRSNLDVDPVPGDAQIGVLDKIGPTFVELGDVTDQGKVDDALDSLLEPKYAEEADPSAVSTG
ncbi:aliphatic sulfonate ABC transporter substrate-binding protein [Epidermidibacterium keratini]|uniref:Putative aliphatic sulfonates-binding protein n=1 Tax=Epidermidibacterium keratini TaxID=1891644 RepID=A0A7L4YJJ5_9ACTN|nr:aliphatic sulfonate ABC transporter substrate-binding protein [Epidermidibacterium keratini]QHB99299.1 aliphatic sulfonate ABC transporter substrate-binding protein [Epidermidibacterium keratini]